MLVMPAPIWAMFDRPRRASAVLPRASLACLPLTLSVRCGEPPKPEAPAVTWGMRDMGEARKFRTVAAVSRPIAPTVRPSQAFSQPFQPSASRPW
ncbi:hypothetical protein SFUMM280S_10311 [Streptomyces fumanus]